MSDIRYSTRDSISVEQFIDVLQKSTLGERRPVDDLNAMTHMVEHADLIATAWSGDQLVGVARSFTDYAYCCYLSDLAVVKEHQRTGIGRALIAETQKVLEAGCQLVLLAAPGAQAFYPKIGFEKHKSAWVLTGKAGPPES